MLEPRPVRGTDPRPLSRKHPDRSRNQEDAQKGCLGPDPVPDSSDLERRKARSRSAMPTGTRESRKGALPGAREDPEGQSP